GSRRPHGSHRHGRPDEARRDRVRGRPGCRGRPESKGTCFRPGTDPILKIRFGARFPPPLWGRVRGGGTLRSDVARLLCGGVVVVRHSDASRSAAFGRSANGQAFMVAEEKPPTLTLPHKGGGNQEP